ncbi:MAG: hypothetical protein PHR13_12305, partial [Dysgonamonadaceae bacterium]|nr:hypothetical protein [Dysgonamonadaceae bacterium]
KLFIINIIENKRSKQKVTENKLCEIHNHEVPGSCPGLATENKEVTKIKFVTFFYLHVICI